jgi:hypothetical protein
LQEARILPLVRRFLRARNPAALTRVLGVVGSAAADMRASAQDVEESRIEGEHKVAIEKCEALPGEAQRACKDAADATCESEKSRLQARMSPSGATGASGTTAAPGTAATPPASNTPSR